MMRLVMFGLVGYLAYRIGREFVESVPADFEPTPTPPRPKGTKARRAARN